MNAISISIVAIVIAAALAAIAPVKRYDAQQSECATAVGHCVSAAAKAVT